jgi:hypothetical protein
LYNWHLKYAYDEIIKKEGKERKGRRRKERKKRERKERKEEERRREGKCQKGLKRPQLMLQQFGRPTHARAY